MRRLYPIIIFCLSFYFCHAQNDDLWRNQKKINLESEKLIEEAIRKGADSIGIYTITNKKNKDVYPEELDNYIREKGYLPIGASGKKLVIYGAPRIIIDKAEFIEKSSFRKYAFYRLMSNSSHTYNYKENATFFIPHTRYSAYYGKEICNGEFSTIGNVLWYGDVVEGFINGKGSGFAQIDDGYCVFSGRFKAGFPTENITLKILHSNMKTTTTTVHKYEYWDFVRSKNNILRGDQYLYKGVIVSASIKAPEISQTVYNAFKEYARLTYKESVNKLNEEYKRTLVVNEKYDGFTSNIDVVNEFIAIFGDWNELDVQNVLPKAKDLIEVNYVLQALTYEFSDNYIKASFRSILTLRGYWNEFAEQKDIKTMNNGLNVVKSKSQDSMCVFKPFYTKALPILETKNKELTAHLDKWRKRYAEYDAAERAKAAESERRYQEWKSEMCDKCKIDGEKTTFPSGYQEGWEFLFFGEPAQSEDDGVIVLVNGEKINWRYIYDDGYYPIYAKGDLFSEKGFESVDEMMKYIVEKCKGRYCR